MYVPLKNSLYLNLTSFKARASHRYPACSRCTTPSFLRPNYSARQPPGSAHQSLSHHAMPPIQSPGPQHISSATAMLNVTAVSWSHLSKPDCSPHSQGPLQHRLVLVPHPCFSGESPGLQLLCWEGLHPLQFLTTALPAIYKLLGSYLLRNIAC